MTAQFKNFAISEEDTKKAPRSRKVRILYKRYELKRTNTLLEIIQYFGALV